MLGPWRAFPLEHSRNRGTNQGRLVRSPETREAYDQAHYTVADFCALNPQKSPDQATPFLRRSSERLSSPIISFGVLFRIIVTVDEIFFHRWSMRHHLLQ